MYFMSYEFKFSHLIPNEQKQYLQKEAWRFKRKLKFWRRYLYMYFTGQMKLELSKMPKNSKNILWMNTTAPSLGDSLMDLAGRVLLKNFNVDLCTSSKNSILYKYDSVFENIYDENNMNFNKIYDLIIVDSYSPRSMRIKNQYFKDIPFFGMYGFVNGFDIHRTLFSIYRISELLGIEYQKTDLRPSVGINNADDKFVDLYDKYLIVVVGGEWEFRTYKHWNAVIQKIIDNENIVLIGSKNGIEDAEEITAKYSTIKNFVGKTTINETAILIRKSTSVICCDGGLLHVANALSKPVVSLFGEIEPYMRHTATDIHESLYDEKSVNNITPESVYFAYLKLKEKL